MNVCVFCSANDLDEVYVRPARELAEMLGKASYTLLWGGSDCGLMKVMADGVQKSGGTIIGVSMTLFQELAHKTADEMIIAKDLAERKALLLQKAEVILVLPGGLGTLDETTEAIELKRHGVHSCDIIILNTHGFYQGLKIQLERMADAGFLPIEGRSMEDWVRFVDTPLEAFAYIKERSKS